MKTSVNCIRQLTSVRSIHCIPLITIHIQIIRTRCRLHKLIVLHRFKPNRPSTTRLRILPTSIMFQNSAAAKHPRCELDIGVRDSWTEEKGTLGIRNFNNFGDFFAEFLGIFDLSIKVLGLEELVESGDYLAVYLGKLLVIWDDERKVGVAYMVAPESTMGFCLSTRRK